MVHSGWYEHFLEVGRLDQALILLDLALCILSTSISSVFMVLSMCYIFCYVLYDAVGWVI